MSYGMIAAAVVFLYLAVVLYVGIFAFRKATTGAEDFFVANRSLGTFVFLLSLFGSNMTSFAILGSSGLAFRIGIGVYGLMASISGIIIPLSIFIIGTRLWAIGKKYGLVTQVQIFRDRWEMGHIGTVIFALQALMLVPYIIIGVMGGGETLEGVSNEAVPYWFGGLIVALVVMSYVFFGGMRGTAWVNTLQTLMFLVFGTITFFIIARGMGGFGNTVQQLARTLEEAKGSGTVVQSTLRAVPATVPAPLSSSAASAGPTGNSQPAARTSSPAPRPDGELLTRARLNKGYYFSYALIPLSSIMFPHIAIFCLTARRMSSFRKTVIFYPLCILAIWLPAVFLGTMATARPEVIADTAAKSQEAQAWLHAKAGPSPDGKQTAPRLNQILRGARDRDPKVAQVLRDVQAGNLTHDQLGDRLDEIQGQLPPLKPELRRLAGTNSDGIMLALLTHFSPALLAGILGAAIMACVMASDSQILALSTMWAEDVYGFYGGRQSRDDRAKVWSARLFVILLTIAAYTIAILVHDYANIFELAIQYAFSGYASMTPIMLACLFWRRSTKWGALLATLWVAGCLIANFILQYAFRAEPYAPASALAPPVPLWSIGDVPILLREYNRISFTSYRFLLVLPMFIGSVIMVVLGSLLTRPPSAAAVARYFPPRTRTPSPGPVRPAAALGAVLLVLTLGAWALAADAPSATSLDTKLADSWPDSGPKQLWSAAVGQGYSSPIIHAGRIYIMGTDKPKETLWCLDANTGKVLWSQSYDGGWHGQYPGSRATPAIDADQRAEGGATARERIYTFGGAGELLCRNLVDGQQLWALNVLTETHAQNLGWGAASSPLVTDRLVYVQGGVGANAPVAVAVDKATGKIAWQSEARGKGSGTVVRSTPRAVPATDPDPLSSGDPQGGGYARPILADVAGTPQLIIFASDQAIAMDPATGKTLWAFPWPTQYQVNASTPVYHDAHLFLTSAYGRGAVMLKLAQGSGTVVRSTLRAVPATVPDPFPEKVWDNKKAAGRQQPAIRDGSNLYLNAEGTILCLDWQTGQTRWTAKDPDLRLGPGGSMVQAGDKLLLLSERGKLTLTRLMPDGLEKLAQSQLLDAREVWSTPLLHQGKLYVKGPTDLLCVDISKTP